MLKHGNEQNKFRDSPGLMSWSHLVDVNSHLTEATEQLYSWEFALIKILSKSKGDVMYKTVNLPSLKKVVLTQCKIRNVS